MHRPISLVVFVAVNYRTNHVRNMIRILDKNDDCIVFVRNNIIKRKFSNCATHNIVKKPWIHYIWRVTPNVTRHYEYVTIILDDVVAYNYSVQTTIQIMNVHKMDVASPRVLHASHAFMGNHSSRPKFIEFFATTFRINAWTCFWEMVNYVYPRFVPDSVGWGYDICFPAFCPRYKHMLTAQTVVHRHTRRRSDRSIHKGYDEVDTMKRAMYAYTRRECVNVSS